ISEWVTMGTTSMILLLFAAFCICYWCRARGERVHSSRLREEFAQEHGLDVAHLEKGKIYRAISNILPSIEETTMA
ncbi:hypothetical protein PENTCL1PPCAC_27238, partial [Pristionchus entomophagus]